MKCVVNWIPLRIRVRSRNTGWRRLIGSPELQIIFHKTATKYRSLLLKMTYKDKGSYESSPPCTQPHLKTHKCSGLQYNVLQYLCSVVQYSVFQYLCVLQCAITGDST